MIRALFFDAAGVLYTRPRSAWDEALRLFAEHGLAVEPNAERESARRLIANEASLGRISSTTYFSRALDLYDVRAPERDAILSAVDRFADEIIPTPGARDALLALKGKGKVLGVITDTMYPLDRKMRWLHRVGVADLLDVVSCSSALGVRKPDPAIYRDARERTGVAASEAAFVGHAAQELDGARAAGMTTVAVWPDPDARADHTVESLAALARLPIL